MSYDYTKIRNKAASAIRKFGRSVTITKPDGTSSKGYGVLTQKENTDGPTSYSQIEQETRELILAGTVKSVPEVGDIVTIGASSMRVQRVNEINPGGTAIIFKLEVVV